MRILVVEDEKWMAERVQKGLIEEGYSIDVTYTGEDAELLLGSVAYDALIIDIKLPGKDGISLCQTVRRRII